MRVKNFFSKINIQIAISFLVFSLGIVIFLSTIFYYSASGLLSKSREKQTKEAITQTSDYVSAYLDKIKTLSNLIAMYPKISEILQRPNSDLEKGLLAMLHISADNDPRIKSIAVISKNGFVITNNSDMAQPLSRNMMNEQWYQAAIQSKQMPVVTSIRNADFIQSRDNLVVSVSHEIVDENKEHLGVVLIDISYRFIEDYISSMDLGNSGYAYILDDKDNVLYHRDASVFMDKQKEKELLELSKKNGKVFDSFIIKTDIPHSNWSLIGVSSTEDIMLLKKQLVTGILFVNLFLILASLVLSLMISKKLTKPIVELQTAMTNSDDSWEHISINPGSSVEIIDLATEYNLLLDRIKALTEDIAQKENTKRIFELKALQSQINPHFLYNTLDTILWLAEFGENEKVVFVSKALGELLRLSLDIHQNAVSLKTELESVENYLKIQQMRYEDKIQYCISGEKELLSVLVPKLILQPIVENSIYHGIRKKKGKGHIEIYYTKEQGNLVITVADDGVGYLFTEKKEERNLIKTKLGGIGMKNVEQRIKLLYGEEFGIQLKERQEGGTIVIYTLKIVEQGVLQ